MLNDRREFCAWSASFLTNDVKVRTRSFQLWYVDEPSTAVRVGKSSLPDWSVSRQGVFISVSFPSQQNGLLPDSGRRRKYDTVLRKIYRLIECCVLRSPVSSTLSMLPVDWFVSF